MFCTIVCACVCVRVRGWQGLQAGLLPKYVCRPVAEQSLSSRHPGDCCASLLLFHFSFPSQQWNLPYTFSHSGWRRKRISHSSTWLSPHAKTLLALFCLAPLGKLITESIMFSRLIYRSPQNTSACTSRLPSPLCALPFLLPYLPRGAWTECLYNAEGLNSEPW